jgi:hypothetical protein
LNRHQIRSPPPTLHRYPQAAQALVLPASVAAIQVDELNRLFSSARVNSVNLTRRNGADFPVVHGMVAPFMNVDVKFISHFDYHRCFGAYC